MLKTIRNATKRENFHLGDSLISCLAIDHSSRKIGNLSNPTTVFFFFDFDSHSVRP